MKRASSASDGSDGYRRPYPEERKQTPEKFQAEDYGLDDDRSVISMCFLNTSSE